VTVRSVSPRREAASARRALDTRELAIADAKEWLSRHEQGAFQSLDVADVMRDLIAALTAKAPEPDVRDVALLQVLEERGPSSLNELHGELKGSLACGGRDDISRRLSALQRAGRIDKVRGGRGGGGRWIRR
jgi:hypothetical protein